ncbi:hypothetical protein Q4503_18490 [Colwellia sp. 6_MG-2023]|nr:hypothetical protein [Colwellia sp. 6_MG-2023]MDO6489686.1 hypothetical protein [Colwellia sp. 6_MG-2023]
MQGVLLAEAGGKANNIFAGENYFKLWNPVIAASGVDDDLVAIINNN